MIVIWIRLGPIPNLTKIGDLWYNACMNKICADCKVEKNSDEFYIRKRNKNGLSVACKECSRIRRKEYYIKNKKRILDANKKWRENNKEKWNKINRAGVKKSRKRNPDKTRAYAAKRRMTTREAYVNYVSIPKKTEILKKQNGVCANCNKKESEIEYRKSKGSNGNIIQWKWELDHVIPISRGGKHSEDNVQVLCWNCNSRKRDKLPADWDYVNGRGYFNNGSVA